MPDSILNKTTILLRLPVGLAQALTTEAEAQRTTRNTLIVGLLAGAVGWRKP